MNQTRHFKYLGVPKTMNSPSFGKIFGDFGEKATSQRTNPQTSPNSAKIPTFGKLRPKGNSFADIGEIGGNKKKSQDVTYAHYNVALFPRFRNYFNIYGRKARILPLSAMFTAVFT